MNFNQLKPVKHLFPIKSNFLFVTVVISCLVLILCNYIFLNPFVYHLGDSIYYGAMADGYKSIKSFTDYTFDPPQPIITLQNGITILHLFLIKLGINDIHIRSNVLQFINIFILFLSFLVLKRIFQIVGTDKKSSIFISLCFISSPPILKTFLEPLNDCYYLLLSFITILLVLSNRTNYRYFLLFLIAIIIGNFRSQSVILFITVSICSLIVFNVKDAIYFFSLSFINLFSPYCIAILFNANFNSVNNQINGATHFFSTFFKTLPIKITSLVELFLGTGYLSKSLYPLASVFILSGFIFMAILFLKYCKEKRFPLMVLTGIIVSNSLFISLFSFCNYRYSILIYPLTLFIIYKFISQTYKLHFLKSIIIFNIILFIGRIFFTDNNYSQNYFSSTNVSKQIGPHPLLSENSRYPYLFLNNARTTDLNSILKSGKTDVMVFGPELYCIQQFNEIKKFRHILSSTRTPLLIEYGNKVTKKKYLLYLLELSKS